VSTRSSALAAVVLAVAVGTAATALVAVDSRTRVTASAEDQREFISGKAVACNPLVPGPDSESWTVATSVPGVPGAIGSGTVRVRSLGVRRGVRSDSPGATVVASVQGREPASVVTADGGLAPGLVAAALSADARGAGKGVASSACQSPGSDLWLLGGGAGDTQRDSLVLANPTTTDAVVDVSVFGRGGRVAATGLVDLGVAAGATRTIRLDVVAPGVSDSAIRVRTKVGIVTAVVVDDRMEGLTPQGTDIISPAGRPQDRALVPVPGGPGARRLLLFAPRDRARVTITAMTTDGPREIFAGEPVTAKRGHVTVVELADQTQGLPAALLVAASAPVLAAASAATEPGRAAAQDVAWFGPAAPLRGTAAAAGMRRGNTVELLMTAADGDAAATVSVLPADTSPADTAPVAEVNIPAGTTQTLAVAAPRGADFFTVVVTPDPAADPPAVAHVQRGSDGAVTGYSLQPLPAWVALPVARPDYGPG
jgi:hypothetical protein